MDAQLGINADAIIPGVTAFGLTAVDAAGNPIAAFSVAVYSDRLDDRARRAAVEALERETRLLERAVAERRSVPAVEVEMV
jgi:DNA-binding IclR family transcriptional regulator